MNRPVVLGNTAQDVIRQGARREVTPNSDPGLQGYMRAKGLLSRQGRVQKQILNNFCKNHAELTQLLKPRTESPHEQSFTMVRSTNRVQNFFFIYYIHCIKLLIPEKVQRESPVYSYRERFQALGP